MDPVLVFDGDCGFCTTAAGFLERRVASAPRRGGLSVVPWQRADLPALGLTEAQCSEAVQFVDAGARSYAGAPAIAAALGAGPAAYRLVGAVMGLPGVRGLAAVVYRWVAAHRHRLPGGTPACRMPPAA